MTNFPWPFNLVQDWLEDLYNQPWESAKWIVDEIEKIMPDVDGALKDFQTWMKDNVKTPIEDAINGISSKLDDFVTDDIGNFGDIVQSLNKSFTSAFDGASTSISEKLEEIFVEPLKGLLERLEKVEEALGPLKDLVIPNYVDILKDIAEALTGMKEWDKALTDVLKEVFTTLPISLPEAFVASFDYLKSLEDLKYDNLFSKASEVISFDKIGEGLKPVRENIKKLSEAIEGFYGEFSPVTPEEAYSKATAHLLRTEALVDGITVGIIAAEALSLGQVDITLTEIFNSPTLRAWMSTAEEIKAMKWREGISRLARYAVWKEYRPWLPRWEDAIKMYFHQLINEEELYEILAYQGWNDVWFRRLISIQRQYPSFSELREMVWRGKIEISDLEYALKTRGIPVDFIEGYKEMLKRIPGPSDLVRFVVREVITPEDFVEWMKKQGYERFWANAYWDAHWQLPDLTRLRKAYLRGVISDEEYGKFIVWHDYSPKPRPGISKSDLEILKETEWDLPGKIDVRWLYRWGYITVDDIKDLLVKDNLHPEWAEKVALAYARQQLSTYISRLETNARYDYTRGYIDRSTLIANLKMLGYGDDFVDFLVSDAEDDRLRKWKDDFLDLVDDMYVNGEIDDDTYRSVIGAIIVDHEMFRLHYWKNYFKRYKEMPPEMKGFLLGGS